MKVVSRETGLSVFLLVFVVGGWWLWGTAIAPKFSSKLAEAYEKAYPRSAERSNAESVAAMKPSQSQAGGLEHGSNSSSSKQDSHAPSSEPPRAPPSLSEYFTRLGQTGDLFGGVNALFASIAAVGVFWAGALQRRTMLEARAAIAHQHFETAFFELLNLTREVLDRFEYEYSTSASAKNPSIDKKRTGFRALSALTVRKFPKDRAFIPGTLPRQKLQHLVNVYKQDVYHQYPSALGPFFRVLYQTFALVDKSPLDPGEKVRYANIARGQLSEASVLLLALNGLTWRGRNFVPLIEQFGLLEHMHPQYLKLVKPILRLAYRERAFLGSKERSTFPSESEPKPGPYAFDRDPDQPDFVVTQPPEYDFIGDE